MAQSERNSLLVTGCLYNQTHAVCRNHKTLRTHDAQANHTARTGDVNGLPLMIFSQVCLSEKHEEGSAARFFNSSEE